MSFTPEARKAELLARLAAEARAKAPAGYAESAAQLVLQLYARVAPDDVLYTAPATLVASVLSLLAHGLEHRRGRADVRLFNPTLASEGWTSDHTVLEIVNDDMPFLVDSTTAAFGRLERTLHLVLHPVVKVERDTAGHLLRIAEAEDDDPSLVKESWMQIQLDQETAADALAALRLDVEGVLSDVRATVEDWQPMRRRVGEILREVAGQRLPLPEDDVVESEAFLRWLDEGHFVFLGYRRYDYHVEGESGTLRPAEGSGLGLLRTLRPESVTRAATPLIPDWVAFARRPELLIVTKANSRSTVHRPVHLDRVSVKRYDAAGNFVGEDRFLGLFTSTAYSRSVHRIPLLRRKAARIAERAGLDPKSHDGKALESILEGFPRDEFFQAAESELFATAMGILALQERQRIAVFTRRDGFGRFVSCLVFVPRDRHNTELRERIGGILENAYEGTVTDFATQLLSDAPLARTLFIVATRSPTLPAVDIKRIEAKIADASRTWEDHLRAQLVQRLGEDEGMTSWRRWRAAFSAAYRDRFSPKAAVYDVPLIDAAATTGALQIDLFRPSSATAEQLRCKLYSVGALDALSDVLPRLENMGVKVLSEMAYEVTPPSGVGAVWVRDFLVASPVGTMVDPRAVHDRFRDTLLRVWRGEVEDDAFNRLVLAAGLEWHQVVVLRAYAKYMRQIGSTFSESYVAEALVRNGGVAALLLEQFTLRFDPARVGNGERLQAEDLAERIETALEAVTNQDEDRILRLFLHLIKATIRTNYYQRDARGERKPYLSMKFKAKRVPDLPKPRPLFEVFVYSPRMEGIHLRGGKVARGGIRWSDRREDFRTEILGLIKAQMVKNAVIVPVGAKGGFVVKRPVVGGSREEVMREGIECYKMLIRGLLDLTDNLRGSEILPPKDVARRDADDPYLVVAADKGTATFSDIANGVAAEYGFWLGDAFASGGSVGYDHKKMAITARGVWEAVKRHFREIGKDIQSEDFTVAGVGDMSGDVFGNAMLLSRHIRLLAAFDHRHIFIDPNPDAATSYAERQRLFDLPRSSWADYDHTLLSTGGGIYERGAKSITVSTEAAALLELSDRTQTPQALMQAILRAQVDLLYFGGIGTYVKATTESHAQVGDRANDAIRVNGAELRSRVLGEGANLGCTQNGRIELGLRAGEAGRLNTDAIDNSAGVDCSDHEVNIKILVDDAVVRGELTPAERSPLLVSMTDEVAELVLRDNYQQTQAISVAQAQGVGLLDAQARLIRYLERAGRLDRAIEFLPDEETLQERQAARLGLTRPEIAVLLAYSKIWIYEELLGSDLLDDPLFATDLESYFPTLLESRLPAALGRHRLRREIIATHVTNSMVNRVGPTFVLQMMEASGRAVSDVARAYTIVRDVFDLRPTWEAIEALDNRAPAALQTSMLIEVGRLLERATLWFLRNGQELAISALTEEFRPAVSLLAERLETVLPAADRDAFAARLAENAKWGLPGDLARRIASLEVLASATDIARLAGRVGQPVDAVAGVYFGLGSRFALERLRAAAALLPADTPWQKAAVAAVQDDLFAHQSALAAKVLAAGAAPDGGDPLAAWASPRAAAVARVEARLAELRGIPALDLAMVTVANQTLRSLVES
jgi:glutamate dehydrogenase